MRLKDWYIFDHCYFYSSYANNTFFLQDTISIKHIVDTFFPYFSELNPNLTKSETAGIEVSKGVQVTLCGMRCTDLNTGTLKILGTQFSYNEKLKEEKKIYDCNRYSTSIGNMEDEKHYTRRKNRFF